MQNNKVLNESCASNDEEAYDLLVNTKDVWIETSWWTTDADKAYMETDNLNGLKLELDESDIYDLIYGDVSVADMIVGFEGKAAGSVDSFEEYYEDLAVQTNYSRSDYPYLGQIKLDIYADDKPVMSEYYSLGRIYADWINAID